MTLRKPCKWQVDEDGVWQTECGHAWEFNEGGPKENGCKFCPYCGGSLVAKALRD